MQFKINKKTLSSLIKGMTDVSTKSIMPDYTFGRKITLQTDGKLLFLTTSNGFLDVKCKIDESKDPNLKIEDMADGICTVDASKFKEIIEKFDGTNKQSILSFSLADNMLSVKDAAVKSKRSAQMPVMEQNHQIDIKVPAKSEKHNIKTSLLSDIIYEVMPFVGQMDYKIELGFLCMDINKDELTCVCGDGGLYAVAKNNKVNFNVESPVRRYFPVDQLPFMLNLLEGSENVEMYFKNDSTAVLSGDNGVQLCLKGIPQLTYTHYENFAFRSSDAKYVVDVKKQDLRTAMEFMGAAEDKEPNDASYFLKCHVTTSEDNKNLAIKVDESNKYRCEEEMECYGHNLGKLEKFHIEMYADILLSLSKQSNSSHLRLFLIEENGLLNAHSVSLAEGVDEKGLSNISPSESGTSVSYFFATVREMA